MHGHKYNDCVESPEGRALWGPRGLDAWYCGPAFDHYRNCKFYVPSTKAYRTSGSYDLFPQHCILPTFTPEQHTQEVYTELFESIQKLTKPAKRKFLRKVAKALEVLTTLPSPAAPPISEGEPTSEGEGDPIVFQRVKDSPMVTTTNNPTDPKMVQTTPRIHQRQTRANNPGQLPAIINPTNDLPTTRRSPRLTNSDEAPIITTTTPSSARIPLHTPNIIALQAENLLTQQVYSETEPTWLPNSFISSSPIDQQTAYNIDIEHFCNGVQHPVSGATITKYKQLIHIPQMREVWTTAFGKEFGNLAQGDDKTGEKGTNSIFVMSHEDIANIPRGRTVTYGRIVIDYRPQKADPNRVRITAGGNLIKD